MSKALRLALLSEQHRLHTLLEQYAADIERGDKSVSATSLPDACTSSAHARHAHESGHHVGDSRAHLTLVKALRSAPTPTSGADGLDRALGRATDRLLCDGRGVLKTVRETREQTRSAMGW